MPDKFNFKLIIEISKLLMQWLPAEASPSSRLNLHLQCQNSFVLSHYPPCSQLCILKCSHTPLCPPPLSTLLTSFLEMDHSRESLFVSSNKPKQAKNNSITVYLRTKLEHLGYLCVQQKVNFLFNSSLLSLLDS